MQRLILGIFLLFIFIINIIIFNGSVLVGDDIYFHFLEDGIRINKELCYGTWTVHLDNLIMYVLPDKLKINFQDWALSFGVFFKALMFTSVILIFIRSFKLKIKETKVILPIMLIIYFLLFIMIKKILYIDFIIYEGFFRFIIAMFALIVFYYYFYKNFCFFINFLCCYGNH